MRFLKRVVAAALAIPLVFASGAVGHMSDTSRVHNIRHIAQAVWGETCDTGTMGLPIVSRKEGLKDYSGLFSFSGVNEYGIMTGCLIQVDGDQSWSTHDLCVLLIHEFGHAGGLGHSTDPNNVMYPFVIGYFEPCERLDGLARPR